jgi:hypothetical protein
MLGKEFVNLETLEVFISGDSSVPTSESPTRLTCVSLVTVIRDYRCRSTKML